MMEKLLLIRVLVRMTQVEKSDEKMTSVCVCVCVRKMKHADTRNHIHGSSDTTRCHCPERRRLHPFRSNATKLSLNRCVRAEKRNVAHEVTIQHRRPTHVHPAHSSRTPQRLRSELNRFVTTNLQLRFHHFGWTVEHKLGHARQCRCCKKCCGHRVKHTKWKVASGYVDDVSALRCCEGG